MKFFMFFVCLSMSVSTAAIQNKQLRMASSKPSRSYLCDDAFREGMNFYLRGNYKKAYEFFLEAANRNDPTAQFAIGCLYWAGMGVALDAAKTLEWYLKAASFGDRDIQYEVGRLYEEGAEGMGFCANSSKAAAWYLKAALQGNWKAQERISQFYLKGKGVVKDEAKGYEWGVRSMVQRCVDTRSNLAVFYGERESQKAMTKARSLEIIRKRFKEDCDAAREKNLSLEIYNTYYADMYEKMKRKKLFLSREFLSVK